MNAKLVCLACALLLTSSAAIANNDDRAPNEISLTGITQFTRPALGLANYGATPMMQSSKVSFACKSCREPLFAFCQGCFHSVALANLIGDNNAVNGQDEKNDHDE
jgi:hypothetical protein